MAGFEQQPLGDDLEHTLNEKRRKSIVQPEVAPIVVAYEPDEVIDIYDTSVSEKLKALLATIHDNDPLEPAYNYSQDSRPSLSASAKEFVPGAVRQSVKPDSESTGSLLRPVISDPGLTDEFAPKLNASAPAFVPSLPKPAISVPTLTSTAAALEMMEKKATWFYKDPSGITRGPYSTTDMRVWSERGYFNGGLEVSRDEKGPFVTLADLYPATEGVPFGRYMDTREFGLKLQKKLLVQTSL